jgi:hypothetical protein
MRRLSKSNAKRNWNLLHLRILDHYSNKLAFREEDRVGGANPSSPTKFTMGE